MGLPFDARKEDGIADITLAELEAIRQAFQCWTYLGMDAQVDADCAKFALFDPHLPVDMLENLRLLNANYSPLHEP